MPTHSALFPALMKFWRSRRGFSQLDLALRAGISPKHVSFLETGRSTPSEEMVMLLAGVLGVSARSRDELLASAGFVRRDAVPQAALDDPHVAMLVDRMLAQHEPFPMLVLTGGYDLLRANEAGNRLLCGILGEVPKTFNAWRAVFSPGPVRDCIIDWPTVAGGLLDRVQRESLLDPADTRLQQLLAEAANDTVLRDALVPPDFSQPGTPVLPLGFRLGDTTMQFVATITRFAAPNSVALDDLHLESWFPADAQTETLCRALAVEGTPHAAGV